MILNLFWVSLNYLGELLKIESKLFMKEKFKVIQILFIGLEETCCELLRKETMCQVPNELKAVTH